MSKDVQFQIVDWNVFNLRPEAESAGSDESEDEYRRRSNEDTREFVVQLYGRTAKGKSVTASVTGYTPFFFVKIPQTWRKTSVRKLETWVRSNMSEQYQSCLIGCKMLRKYDFRGFSNFTQFRYARFVFTNTLAMRECVGLFQLKYYFEGDRVLYARAFNKEKRKRDDEDGFSPESIRPDFLGNVIGINKTGSRWTYNVKFDNGRVVKSLPVNYLEPEDWSDRRVKPKALNLPFCKNKIIFDLYETKIEPMLRLGHIRNIQPAGWVCLPGGKYDECSLEEARVDSYSIKWTDIEPVESTAISPLVIASYDIECASSHGDFPQARKNYKKLAEDFVMAYLNIRDNKPEQIDNLSEYMRRWLELAFSDNTALQEIEGISRLYPKRDAIPTESQFEDIGRRLYALFDSDSKKSRKGGDDGMQFFDMSTKSAKGKITSRRSTIRGMKKREMITFMTEWFDKEFNRIGIELEGDPVIQIGTVFMRFGEDEPYLHHIITLDTCDAIEGAEVVACKTEEEVLMEWMQLIQREDPDIITGYNIFGFDYKYMVDRAKELSPACFVDDIPTTDHKRAMYGDGCGCIYDRFMNTGRLSNRKSYLRKKILASAALGNNEMYILMMNGRLSIDLLKVVRRDYNLGSYKLDNVSAHFIRGKLKSAEYDEERDITKMKTDSIRALRVGGYIVIMINRGTYEEKFNKGQKFQVVKVENGEIEIDGLFKMKKRLSYNWCQAKDDVSPQQIFQFQREGPDKRAIVARYCIKDCVLCLDLMKKLSIIPNNIGMANVCSVPLSYIFQRGQGIKVFSLVSKECYKLKYLIPELYNSNIEGGYEGAIVLKPIPGIYLDKPIAVLDYASLYPSSMISHNLSHDSIVLDEQWLGDDGRKKLEKMGYEIEDVAYDIYKWEREAGKKTRKKVNTGEKKVCRYVQPRREEDGSIKTEKRGIIPRILQSLLDQRKKTRKRIKYKTVITNDNKRYTGMVSEKDGEYKIIREINGPITVSKDIVVDVKKTFTDFENKIWDGLQLAYKVTANSMYGSIGAKTSNISYIDIAASTTAVGRMMLETAADFALKRFPRAEITYGDSIPGDEPLMLRDQSGNIVFRTINTLGDIWKSYEEFKPFDTISSNRRNKGQSTTDYEVWTNGGWTRIKRVIRHRTNKKLYRVNTHCGIVTVTEDHSLLDEKINKIKPGNVKIGETQLLQDYPSMNEKNPPKLRDILINIELYKHKKIFKMGQKFNNIVPDKIINSSKNIRYEYFLGYYSMFGEKDNICFSNKGKIGSAGLYYLVKSLGYNASISMRSDKLNVYRIRCSVGPLRKPKNIIKKIYELDTVDDYVYDLETEEGIYGAGIGEIIVKNTDSIFVNFNCLGDDGKPLAGREALKRVIECGVTVENEIKPLLKAPHHLEYEKTFWPFILFSKKRYVGNKYEFDLHKFKQTCMGIVLKRRDNAPIVKLVYGGIIDILMDSGNISDAIDYLQACLMKIVEGVYPIDLFIISKSLKPTSAYANPMSIAHWVLANRMGERDPGNKPKSNDRIPYVYIEVRETKSTLQGDRIEHPRYVIDNKLKIDYGFYITNQIMKPVSQIFDLVSVEAKGGRTTEELFEDTLRIVTNRKKGLQTLDRWFS